MTDGGTPQGLLRIRGHCLFTWESTPGAPDRKRVVVLPSHCAACIAELKRTIGPSLSLVFSAGDG